MIEAFPYAYKDCAELEITKCLSTNRIMLGAVENDILMGLVGAIPQYGITLANKYKNNNYYTYVICGDGEFEEGQVYEALMAASHYQLSHFILFLDYNGLQIDGKIVDVIGPQPFLEKFLAFGFEVININGHDFDEIEAAVEMAKNSQKPTAIIAHTVKGKGISFMENEIEWHGKAPNRKEMEQALRELGGH